MERNDTTMRVFRDTLKQFNEAKYDYYDDEEIAESVSADKFLRDLLDDRFGEEDG